MSGYIIQGNNKLEGSYKVKGAKNSILPLLATTIALPGEHCIVNCPQISDVDNMLKILMNIGAKVMKYKDSIFVDSRYLKCSEVPENLMSELRSSIFVMGALVGRTGEAKIFKPGGCNIGKRPIDLHCRGLEALGVDIKFKDDMLECYSNNLNANRIRLPFPSVGATENIMLASIRAEGVTIIENAAREPEIKEVADYINAWGGKIRGAGSKKIVIYGTKKSVFRQMYAPYDIIGDRIEAVTYLAAVAGTGGEVYLTGIDSKTLKPILGLLSKIGCNVKWDRQKIYLKAPEVIKGGVHIKTEPYPGFPTDCQQIMMALLSKARKESCIEEHIFESRFSLADDIKYMGGSVEITGRNAIIKPNDTLYGKEVLAKDLRGGAALVVLGLMSEGVTVVKGIEHIKRGYESMDEVIRSLGGEIYEENYIFQ